ncbi:MAG: hypothetical protein KAR21_18625 [Spirochaetales bacterium]|nr:hypothetical protein [Spirochaetales bacterium]
MKKFIFIFMILFITALTVSAQDIFDPRLLTQIDLSAEEIEEIQEIQYQAEKKIREANVEMNVLKAQLEKLLLDEHPDMGQVRKTIEATLRWRIQTEIANVEARVQIREKIGSENWEELLRLRKKILQRIQNNNAIQNQEAPNTGNVRPRN